MVTGYFRECSNPDCGFRYPDLNTDSDLAYCPKCGEIALIFNRALSDQANHKVLRSHIEIIPLLDNIRSVYNVGSIIRTCEGFGINEIILSGITPALDHPRIDKTGLGAIPKVKWQHVNNGFRKVVELKTSGFQIISLESSQTALPIVNVLREILSDRICLVLGNENLGVDPEIQRISDLVVAIPMAGEKESFNVSVAFGIAAYHLVEVARI